MFKKFDCLVTKFKILVNENKSLTNRIEIVRVKFCYHVVMHFLSVMYIFSHPLILLSITLYLLFMSKQQRGISFID